MKAEINTIEDILNSNEFNALFDVEAEKKEIEQSGWTIEEARKFAQFLIKNK